MALPGQLPAYRAMAPGMDGPDIAQLQQGLVAAGFPTKGDVDGHYGPATARAVQALYKARGVQASIVGEREVAAAVQALRTAEQSLEQAKLAASGTGGSSTALRYAREDLKSAQAALAEARARSGAQVPLGEIVFVPSLPAQVTTLNATVGADAAGDLLAVTSGPLVVRGRANAVDAARLAVGARARLLMASGGDAEGTVAVLAATPTAPGSAQAAGPPAGPPTVDVTITPDTPLPAGLRGQPVRAVVTLATSPGQGLTVPVAAISTSASGTTSVTVVSEGGSRRLVPVTTGFTGEGYVQVVPQEASALRNGDQVLVGVTEGPGSSAAPTSATS